MLLNILVPLIVLNLVIFIHELGHFLAAVYFAVPVKEFSIGIGPTLFKFEGKKAKYNLRIIPIGGYVAIEGMDSSEENNEAVMDFYQRRFVQKFSIIFAGVFMNFIVAILIFISLGWYNGTIDYTSTVITNIEKDTEAAKLLKLGDKIVAVNGTAVNSWTEVTGTVRASDKDTVLLTIERNNSEKLDVELNILYKDTNSSKFIYFGVLPLKRSFIGAVNNGLRLFVNRTVAILKSLVTLISKERSIKSLSGPLGISKTINEAAKHGIQTLFSIIAMISLSIGIFNLLPLPAVDGSRIIFIILGLFGLKINRKIEETIHSIGLILLLLLTILVTKNDILRMFKS